MTTIIEDHGYPLIWFGDPMRFDPEGVLIEEDNVTEPRTEAGRAPTARPTTKAGQRVVNDVREVVVYNVTDRLSHGFGLAWAVEKGVVEAEQEAATLALADVAEKVRALPFPGASIRAVLALLEESR